MSTAVNPVSLKDKSPVNNIPSSTFSPKKQQRCNLDRYSFVYVSSLEGELLFVSVMEQITLKNSVLVVKKQHDFVADNVPNRMKSSKKKKVKDTREDWLFEFWRSLATTRDARCDAPVIWWGVT